MLAVSDQTVLVGTSQVDAYVRDPNGDWSLQGEPIIDWVKVATEFRADNTLKYLAGQ